MSLEKLVVDLNNANFPGQCYVALSRLKSLGGLYLKGLDIGKIKVDHNAKRCKHFIVFLHHHLLIWKKTWTKFEIFFQTRCRKLKEERSRWRYYRHVVMVATVIERILRTSESSAIRTDESFVNLLNSPCIGSGNSVKSSVTAVSEQINLLNYRWFIWKFVFVVSSDLVCVAFYCLK